MEEEEEEGGDLGVGDAAFTAECRAAPNPETRKKALIDECWLTPKPKVRS